MIAAGELITAASVLEHPQVVQEPALRRPVEVAAVAASLVLLLGTLPRGARPPRLRTAPVGQEVEPEAAGVRCATPPM